MKKKTIFIILCVIIVSLLSILITIVSINIRNTQIEKNIKLFSDNIKNPDRIVYKNGDKYYEFNKNDESYKKIIEKLSEKNNSISENSSLSQEKIDKIHDSENFIELDYNTISKNFIMTLNNKDNQFIKLLDNGGTVLNKKVSNLSDLKKLLDRECNSKKYYVMNENKEYISENLISSIKYEYLQQFKQINQHIYQVKISNKKDFLLYTQMCNLKFKENLTDNVFEDNVLILTLSIPRDILVTTNIGNIRYHYDNKINNYEYTAHLLLVNKIVNSDCIYNTDDTIISEMAAGNELSQAYNDSISNLNTDVFVKDFDSYLSNIVSDNKISLEVATQTAEIAFKEATRIAGTYDKKTQTHTLINVYPNNFFTRKSSEVDKIYNTKLISSYEFKRFDDMGNGISVYIDASSGKVIGGKAFGD